MANNGALSQEQWQEFMAGMQAQNAQLAQQLAGANQQIVSTNQQIRQAAIDQLEPEKKVEALQSELNMIKNAAAQAQSQQMSNDVWQRRDAEAAARLITMAGLSGNEPELYHQPWDVNWMPRFVASVENHLSNRRRANASNANNNPANRANVGNGTGQGLPEIDVDKASGADLIQFALQRGNR